MIVQYSLNFAVDATHLNKIRALSTKKKKEPVFGGSTRRTSADSVQISSNPCLPQSAISTVGV